MNKKILAIVFCIFAVFLLLLSLCRSGRRESQASVEYSAFEALGEVLIEEVVERLGDNVHVLLITRNPRQANVLGLERTHRGLRQGARRHPQLSLEEYVWPEPGRPEEIGAFGLILGHEYVDVVRSHPQAHAVISLAGMPLLDAQDLRQLRDGPMLIAQWRGEIGALPLLQQGYLELLVIPGRHPDLDPSLDPNSPRAIALDQFTLGTAEMRNRIP